MSTQHGYNVDPNQLRGVATQLRGDADQVETVRGRVGGASVADTAFGASQSSPAAAAAWKDAIAWVDRRLTGTKTYLTKAAEGLVTVADRYQQADQEIAQAIGALHKGSRGSAVRQLQQDLKTAGYNPGTVDGVYGGKTQDAVDAYLADHGMTAQPAH